MRTTSRPLVSGRCMSSRIMSGRCSWAMRIGCQSGSRLTVVQVAVLIVCCAISCAFLWLRFSLGTDVAHDFTAFYLAGRIPLGSLYDQEAFEALGQQVLR